MINWKLANKANQNYSIKFQGSYPSRFKPENDATNEVKKISVIVFQFLVEEFIRPANIWLIVLSGLSFGTYREVIPYILLPLCLNFVLDLIISFCENRRIFRKPKMKNSETTKVWDGEIFRDLKNEEVLIGDLVLLEKNKQAPLDTLILFTQKDCNWSLVQISNILPDKNFYKKFAVENFRSQFPEGDISQAIKMCDFKVDFTVPNEDVMKFKGNLNFKGSPGGLKFSVDNLVFAKSVLKSDWAVGLVVLESIKNSQNYKSGIFDLDKKTRVIEWVMFGVFGGLVLIFTLLDKLLLNNNDLDTTGTVVYFSVKLSYFFALFLSVMLNLVRILQLRILKKLNPFVKFKGLKYKENLAKVKSAFVDKSCLIDQESLSVSSCYVRFNYFEYDPELQDRTVMKDNSELSQSILKDSEIDEDDPYHLLFVKSLVFCNYANLVGNNYYTKYEDKVIEDYFNELGANFSVVDSEVDLYFNNLRFRFQLCAFMPSKNSFSKVRIIVKDLADQRVYMFLRCSKNQAFKTFSSSDLSRLNYCKLKNKACLFYGVREMSQEELSEFMESHSEAKLSVLDPEAKLEELFESLEKNSLYLGMISLDEGLVKEAFESFKALNKAGIKQFFFDSKPSGYFENFLGSHLNTYKIEIQNDPCALKLELEHMVNSVLFDDYDENLVCEIEGIFKPLPDSSFKSYSESDSSKEPIVANLRFEQNSRLHPFIKNLLTKNDNKIIDLERKLNPRKFNLAIPGNSLETAFGLEENKFYLATLVLLASSVSVSSASPYQKRLLSQFVQELFPDESVLCVFNSEAEVPFLCDSTINARLKASKADSPFLDFTFTNFNDLKELLLEQSPAIYCKLYGVFKLFFYTLFVWFFCGLFLGAESKLNLETLEQDLLTVLIYLGILVHISYTGLKFSNSKSVVSETNPKDLLVLFFEAVVNSLVIYFSVKLGFSGGLNSSGYTEDLRTIRGFLTLCLFFSAELKLFLSFEKFSVKKVVYNLGILLVILVLICLELFYTQRSGYDIFSSPRLIILVLATPAINLMVFTVLQFAYPRSQPKSLKSTIKGFESKLLNSTKKTEETYTDINKNYLCFKSKAVEDHYLEQALPQMTKKFRLFLVLMYVLSFSFQMWVCFFLNYNLSLEFIVIYNSAKAAVILLAYWTKLVNKQPSVVNFLFGVGYLTLVSITYVTFEEVSLVIFTLNPIIFYFCIYSTWRQATFNSLIAWVVVLVYSFNDSLLVETNDFSSYSKALDFNIFYLASNFLCAAVAYQQNLASRVTYSLANQVRLKAEKAADVVGFLFPNHVAEKLLMGDQSISNFESSVTVVFCNISEFSEITNYFTPEELNSFLDFIFKRFDRLCSSHGASKIETVGNTFLACVGLSEVEERLHPELRKINHAERALDLACAMILEIKDFNWKYQTPIKLKIGLDSGSIISGVVGHHKPQFCLVGDTINTASRMASTLKTENYIQLSERTYELLENPKNLQKTQVEAKGKGTMTTYTLNEKSISLLSLFTIQTKFSNSKSMDYKSFTKNFKPIIAKSSVCSGLSDLLSLRITPEVNQQRKKRLRIFLPMYKQEMKVILLVGVSMTIITFIDYLLNRVEEKLRQLLGALLFLGAYSLIMILVKKVWKKLWIAWTSQVFYGLFLLGVIIVLADEIANEILSIVFIFSILHMGHCSMLVYKNITQTLVVIYTSLLLIEIFLGGIGMFNNVLVLIFLVLTLLTLYFREKQFSFLMLKKSSLEKELKKIEELISKLLPDHVYNNLKKEELATDEYKDMTILYADIVGFTSWSGNKSPQEVLDMLNSLFKRFDEISVEHNVYKVHTIGDCYVVLGDTSFERDPVETCKNVLEFAEDMIAVIEEVNQAQNLNLKMRVGVHTGQVIAGVSGTTIIRYDIYGEDVLIANKLESQGKPDEILVSENTKKLLETRDSGKHNFELNEELELNTSQGLLKTYFLKSN